MSTAHQPFGGSPEQLAVRAAEVLRENDLGGWTKAAPRLYPHQWSWDSAFIAIGLAHLDTRRAAQELRVLFAAQWATGMVPHIVFNPAAGGYFPDPARWGTTVAPAKPADVLTSGMCQPPVHAIAAHAIWETARQRGEAEAADATAFLRELYPRLLAWHRYLATDRDPERSGLVTIYHPWESGADNSPAWDSALAAITVGDLPPYERHDLKHADPSMRPTMVEYDRYLWIVEVMKRGRYDEATTYRTNPFLVKVVWFSAIFVAANDALLKISDIIDAPDAERATITEWRDRGLRGLEERWDPTLGLCLDYDLRAGQPIPVRVMGGFAPLIAGHLTPERQAAILATLDGSAWLGHPRLRWPVPPSTSPDDPAFDPHRYWRGPTWPVMNWLFWWALLQAGETERAANLRQASLDQLTDGLFGEYYEPFTGEPLGSLDQSWTAAVALDWLAKEQ
ncbi:MAG: glycogen debranching protein [Chloroflexota bacterium]|nr:glycogen debranching protein [Chloroflexota bacterium]